MDRRRRRVSVADPCRMDSPLAALGATVARHRITTTDPTYSVVDLVSATPPLPPIRVDRAVARGYS